MAPAAGSTNKIFVGGLPQSCAEEVLSNYFMQYGNIVDSVVMKDRETGNSRGFGFVTYDSAAAVEMVMSQYSDHRIGNKWVEVKRAVSREDMAPGGGARGRSPRDGRGARRPSPRPRRSRDGPRDRSGDRGDGGGARTKAQDRACPRCRASLSASEQVCRSCSAREGSGHPAAGGPPPPGVGYPPPVWGPWGMPGYGYDPLQYPAYPTGPPPGAYYGGYAPYGACRAPVAGAHPSQHGPY